MDRDCVKNKFHGDLTSERLDLYEFKMALSDNGDVEEFLLFIRNFQMTPEASGTLASGAKIQYLCTLVHDKSLCQLGTLSAEVEITTSEHLKSIILGLGTHFSPVDDL